jgi:aryl-alcohol dehydrogenase-like predicted oxidoreductase
MWSFDPSQQDAAEEIETMHALMERLKAHVAEGKIRAFGLSNESAWGTMQWLRAGEATGGPRIASMQNEYSLLYRQHDTDHAEVARHEDVTLLAFSPLATGLLTGKYQNGVIPPGSRRTIGPELGGRVNDRVFPIIDLYLEVAKKHGLDPAQMAIAWCLTRPFPVIPIFGATTETQLETAIGADGVQLSAEVLAELDAVNRANPHPF